MDSTKRDNKEVQEKLMALQKEKDQVSTYNRSAVIICIYQLYVLTEGDGMATSPVFPPFFRVVLRP